MTAILDIIFNYVLAAFSWAVVKFNKHWKPILIVIGIVFFVAFIVLATKSCGKQKVLTPKEVVEAQTAIAERDEAKMREILVQSDVREEVGDSTITNAKKDTINAAKESRDRWQNATPDEMAEELERRARP